MAKSPRRVLSKRWSASVPRHDTERRRPYSRRDRTLPPRGRGLNVGDLSERRSLKAADSLLSRQFPPPRFPSAAIRRRSSRAERLGEIRPELGPEAFVLKTKINDRLQVLELVSGVEVTGILDLISEEEVAVVNRALHRILQRKFLASAKPGGTLAEAPQYRRREEVPAHAREIRPR